MRRVLLLLALAALVLPAPAQSPHTAAPLNNAPGTFRFAILPDRTGGMRRGPFEEAITKLQWLQPEFVMSVGDLVDGYTTDPKVWTAQWDEFDAEIRRLGMRFYFVPGNHDISNPELLDVWRRRHGPPWTSFVHEKVLFLTLHTEDRLDGGGLGPEQIAWVRDTLAKHADVRWTLLFFHRPLWRERDQRGFDQVRAALRGRPYTVFAGHNHSYLKDVQDGMHYYVLATAGGSSDLRGVEFGEFDHVTWVTMKPDGPVVANLALSGIVADDIVNSRNVGPIDALRDGRWLHVAPVLHDQPTFSRVALDVELRNPTDLPLRVHGTLPTTPELRFEPAHVDQTVPPRTNTKLPLVLVAAKTNYSLHTVNEHRLAVLLDGTYEINGQPLTLSVMRLVNADWPHVVPRATQAVTLTDASLADWPETLFVDVTQPMTVKEDWDWHGPEDGRFRFAVQQHDGSVFVAIRTFDDHVNTAPDSDALQDKLMVQLRTSTGAITLSGVAGTNQSTANVRAVPGGLEGEFKLPLPADARTFHLNIGWQDHDRTDHTKPSVLWWRDPKVEELGEFRIQP